MYIHTYQGVGDGVPHPLDGAAAAALADEPVREADPVEGAHVLHGGVEVEEGLRGGGDWGLVVGGVRWGGGGMEMG